MKFFLSILLVFASFYNKGYTEENNLKINQKILFHDNLFIVASDNSIWEVFLFDLRSQTWNEWWNNIKISIKDEFNFDEKCWQIGDNINFNKNDIDDSVIENLSEKDKISWHNFPFLIINHNSNKIAFTRPLSFEAFTQQMIDIAAKQSQKSYDKGYSDGRILGYNNGHSVGYNTGYNTGYSEGYNIGYNTGYNTGYTAGRCCHY